MLYKNRISGMLAFSKLKLNRSKLFKADKKKIFSFSKVSE